MRLRVTDDDGNAVITTRTVQVGNRAPTAKIRPLTAPAQKDVNITFKSDSTDEDAGRSARPSGTPTTTAFDDGTGTPDHKPFPTTGPKTIRLG